jgi:hypothetical protein
MNRFSLLPIAILALLAGVPGLALAQGALPDGLYGKFRGVVAAPGNAGDQFTVDIEKRRGGFTVRWSPRIVVEFDSAGRPGVFRGGGSAKPMTGDPVYWARLAEGRLLVYAMQLDEHGGYSIRRFDYTPAGDGLDLVIRRISTGGIPVEWTGRLDRHGG